MKERFEGTNRGQLIAAIRRQEFANNNIEIAEALAAAGELVEIAPGANLIVQNDTGSNDIFLLIAGVVTIVVHGSEQGMRKAGQHVGEMAAIEPSLPRSATVTVLETVVALKLSSAAFMTVGEAHPEIWLPIARELARRLHARNAAIFPPNESPKLFIISSSEALTVAEALRDGLAPDVFSLVWKEGTFFAGGYTIEALENKLKESDFAVAIAEPDDIVESRGSKAVTMRDNVLFELGLFMGRLTRYRAILVHPRVKDLKLPSDLQGLTLIPYDPGDPSTVSTRIAHVCKQVREVVKRLGVRTFTAGS